MDIENRVETTKAFEELKRRERKPDLVINLAGFDISKRFSDMTEEENTRTISVNPTSTVLIVRQAVEILFEGKPGVLFCINAFAGGRLCLPGFSLDETSRAAMSYFFRFLEKEHRNPGTAADKFLIRLARSKNDITPAGPGEVILAFLDNVCPALANKLFYNSFVKKTIGQ